MERNKRNKGTPAITIRLRFYMRSANASLEPNDRFLAHMASCLSKTMGLERAKTQVPEYDQSQPECRLCAERPELSVQPPAVGATPESYELDPPRCSRSVVEKSTRPTTPSGSLCIRQRGTKLPGLAQHLLD